MGMKAWWISSLLLVLLAGSVVLNGYQYLTAIKPLYEEDGGEGNGVWIRGFGHDMWTAFSIKLTPNRAVFHSSDRQFNVSVRGSFWAPYTSGAQTFHFKIYAQKIYAGVFPVDEIPILLAEKAFVSNKSEDEYHYEILFNFTVTLDMMERGIHYVWVEGGGAEASFAINYK